MNDMSAVIVPKSDQINADDLIAGPRTIRITEVDIRPGTEQPVSIYFDGDDGKPWKPCKSMSRVLVAAWGPDAKAYVGRSVTLYRDPKVKWGGMDVGGIRVSHLSHIEREMVMALTATKGKRAPHVVKPLAAEVVQHAAATLTIEQAEADLRAAFTLDDLRAAWTRKVMAPHRTALQPVLDEMKRALAEPEQGRDDAEMGESNTLIPTDEATRLAETIIKGLRAAKSIDMIGEIMAAQAEVLPQMPRDQFERIHAVRGEVLDGLKGGVA